MEVFAETGIPEFDILHVGRFQSLQEILSEPDLLNRIPD